MGLIAQALTEEFLGGTNAKATVSIGDRLREEFPDAFVPDEPAVKKMAKSAASGAVGVLSSAQRSIPLAAAAAYDAAAIPQNMLAKWFDVPSLRADYDSIRKSKLNPLSYFDASSDQLDKVARSLSVTGRYDDTIVGYLGSGDYANAGELLMYSVFENIPQLVFQYAATAAGHPGAALALLGASASGSQYAEVSNKADMTKAQKYINSFAAGAAEALFERYGTQKIMERIAKGNGKEAMKFGLLRGLRAVTTNAGQEASEETLTQLTNNFFDRMTNNRRADGTLPDLTDGVGDSAIVGAVLGALMGGAEAANTKSRDDLVKKLAISSNWNKATAAAVVDRAARRKGKFDESLKLEIADELTLYGRGLEEWADIHPDKARALADVESPSRRDFDAAGLPRRPAATRKEVADSLRELLAAKEQAAPESEAIADEPDAKSDTVPPVEESGDVEERPAKLPEVQVPVPPVPAEPADKQPAAAEPAGVEPPPDSGQPAAVGVQTVGTAEDFVRAQKQWKADYDAGRITQEELGHRAKEFTVLRPPPPDLKPAPPAAGRTVESAVAEYRAGELSARDLADAIEGMDDAPEAAVAAVARYRAEQREDATELGKRGDVEAYEEAFVSALEAAGPSAAVPEKSKGLKPTAPAKEQWEMTRLQWAHSARKAGIAKDRENHQKRLGLPVEEYGVLRRGKAIKRKKQADIESMQYLKWLDEADVDADAKLEAGDFDGMLVNADEHRNAVKTALAEGFPVPPAVLADYPELQRIADGTKRVGDTAQPSTSPAASTGEPASEISDPEATGEPGGRAGQGGASQVPRFELGRMIAGEVGQSALRPTPKEIKAAAVRFGVSFAEAQRALSVFNDPDGGVSPESRQLVDVAIPAEAENNAPQAEQPRPKVGRKGAKKKVASEPPRKSRDDRKAAVAPPPAGYEAVKVTEGANETELYGQKAVVLTEGKDGVFVWRDTKISRTLNGGELVEVQRHGSDDAADTVRVEVTDVRMKTGADEVLAPAAAAVDADTAAKRFESATAEVSRLMKEVRNLDREANVYAQQNDLLYKKNFFGRYNRRTGTTGASYRAGQVRANAPSDKVVRWRELKRQHGEATTRLDEAMRAEAAMKKDLGNARVAAVANNATIPEWQRLMAKVDLLEQADQPVPAALRSMEAAAVTAAVEKMIPDATRDEIAEIVKKVRAGYTGSFRFQDPKEYADADNAWLAKSGLRDLRQQELKRAIDKSALPNATHLNTADLESIDSRIKVGSVNYAGQRTWAVDSGSDWTRAEVDAALATIARLDAKETKEQANAKAEAEKAEAEARSALIQALESDDPATALKDISSLGPVSLSAAGITGELKIKPVMQKIPAKKNTVKALSKTVSPDPTHKFISQANAQPAKGFIEATDGRRLVRVPYSGKIEGLVGPKTGKKSDVDGTYPNTDQIIPAPAMQQSIPIKSFDGLLYKLAGATQVVKALKSRESNPIMARLVADGKVIGDLNPVLLFSTLRTLAESKIGNVTIGFTDPESPITFRSEDNPDTHMAVIMPFRDATGAHVVIDVGADYTSEAMAVSERRKAAATEAGDDTGGDDDGISGYASQGRDKRPERAIGGHLQDGTEVSADAPVQAAEVMTTIRSQWPGLAISGALTHRRKNPGWYDRSLGLMRLRDVRDVPVAIHELGHHFDRELGVWSKQKGLPRGVTGELIKLGRDLYGSKRPAGGYRPEGFAEFIRAYLSGEEVGQSAPATMKWFTAEYLANNPGEAKKLLVLEDVIARFQLQTPEQAIRAFRSPIRKDWSAQRIAARLAAQHIDDLLPVLREMQATGADLNSIAPEDHAFMLLTHYKRTAGGRAAYAALEGTYDLAGNKTGIGLREAMEPVSAMGEAAIEEWTDYAIARKAIILHERGINPGIAMKDAQAYVDKHKSETFDKVLDDVTAWSRRVLHLLVESGAMTEAEFESIEKLNPVYVPFARQFGEGELKKGRKGFGGRGVHRFSKDGSGREVHNPIEALIVQAEKIMGAAMQADVCRALVKFYDTQKGKAPALGTMMKEIPAPVEATTFSAESIKKDIAKKAVELGADPDEVAAALIETWDERLTVFTQGKEFKGKENVVALTVDGKRRFFEVSADLKAILEGLNKGGILPGKVGELSRAAVGLMRLGATGLNPTFGVVLNPLRDALTATVTSEYHFHVPVYSTLRGMIMDIANTETAQRYHALGLDIGGSRAGQDMGGNDVLRTVSDTKVGKAMGLSLGKTPASRMAGRVKAHGKLQSLSQMGFISGLREILGHSEIGPRLMEFQGAYEYGMEKWKSSKSAAVLASCAAKDLTVNFTRAGSVGRAFNEVVLFYNAGVQSIDKVLRTSGAKKNMPWSRIKDKRVAAINTLARGAGLLTVAAVMNYLRNRDKEWWKDLPPYEKWMFMHVGNLENNGRAARIPLPFEIGFVFGALPIALAEEKRNPGALREALGVFADNASPVEFGSIHKLARNVSLVAPAADVLANRRWNDSVIVPQNIEKNRIPSQQYGAHATELAKRIGALAPGGYSPAKIDHLLDGYTGGLYKRLAGALNVIFDPSSIGAGGDLSTIPVLGALFLRPSVSRVTGDFYDRLEELRQRKGSDVASLAEIGELAEAEKLSRGYLQGAWKTHGEMLKSDLSAGRKKQESTRMLKEIQTRIKAHQSVKDYTDAGIQSTVYAMTDPGVTAGKRDMLAARIEGVSKKQAMAALVAAAKTRPRTSSGRLSAFGERQERLLKVFSESE